MYAQDTVSVLNTSVTISHGDAVVDNHVLTITGCPAIDVREIESMTIQSGVAEVLQVTTLTPTSATKTAQRYAVVITQLTTAGLVSFPIELTTDAAYATLATDQKISDAFRAAIATSPLQVTTSGTTTCIITAVAGSPIFAVSILAIGEGLTQSTGTPGVARVNTTAALTAAYPSLTFTSGKKYDRYTFVYRRNGTNAVAGNSQPALCRHTLLVQDDATNNTGTPTAAYTSAAGATSAGNIVTVTTTASLKPGMTLAVTAGTGAVAAATRVLEVLSSTTFSTTTAPTTAFSGGATVVTGTTTNLQAYMLSLKAGSMASGFIADPEFLGF